MFITSAVLIPAASLLGATVGSSRSPEDRISIDHRVQSSPDLE